MNLVHAPRAHFFKQMFNFISPSSTRNPQLKSQRHFSSHVPRLTVLHPHYSPSFLHPSKNHKMYESYASSLFNFRLPSAIFSLTWSHYLWLAFMSSVQEPTVIVMCQNIFGYLMFTGPCIILIVE